jgi:hypothetical protein
VLFSQDDTYLLGSLNDLLEKASMTKLTQYFRTAEAKTSNSRARQLIESAS